MKLLLTFTLVAGTPISVACHLANLVEADLCWFLFGATSFSLCTLCVFSYFSTKVIGVVRDNTLLTQILLVVILF